jgi:hypothetical protein
VGKGVSEELLSEEETVDESPQPTKIRLINNASE